MTIRRTMATAVAFSLAAIASHADAAPRHLQDAEVRRVDNAAMARMHVHDGVAQCRIEHPNRLARTATPRPPVGNPAPKLMASAADGKAISDSDLVLDNGANVSLTLPAATGQGANPSIIGSISLDIPAGTRWIDINLAATENSDVDLWLRRGPLDSETLGAISGGAPELVDYYSTSPLNEERIAITGAHIVPVDDGPWQLAVVNYGAATEVSLSFDAFSSNIPKAQFIVDYQSPNCESTAEWFSSSSFTPVGGNDASTLGEARRNAFERALEVVAEEIRTPIPITIQACWTVPEQDDDDNGGTTLAFAGPSTFLLNTPGLPVPQSEDGNPVLYPIGTASHLAGTDMCRVFSCGDGEVGSMIRASFNPEANFSYSLDQDAAFSQPGSDFVATAAHEVTHGLGFLSTYSEDGSRATTNNGSVLLDDIYSVQMALAENGELKELTTMSDAERAAAMTSGDDLKFVDPAVFLSSHNAYGTGIEEHPSLYSPANFDPGSSVSHLGSSFVTSFEDLMYPRINGPSRTMGISADILHAVGWNTAPTKLARGMFYDPRRDGHGLDLQAAGAVYFGVFYSFDDNGEPVWFAINGELDEGVIDGVATRFAYENGAAVPQGEAEPATVSFRRADYSRGCQDGLDRDLNGVNAVLGFKFDQDQTATDERFFRTRQWCLQPLTDTSGPAGENLTGHWYAGEADSGWGMTIYQQGATAPHFLAVVLYYYDGSGVARWSLGTTSDFDPAVPVTLDMLQFSGQARNESAPHSGLQSTQAGNLTLSFTEASTDLAAGNAVTVDVEYLGANGGGWEREDQRIQLLSSPIN